MSDQFIRLRQAVKNNNLAEVKSLLKLEENGVEGLLKERDPKTFRSILFSVLWNDVSYKSSENRQMIFKLLLNNGADLGAQDNAGFSIFHYSQGLDIDTLRFLLLHYHNEITSQQLLLKQTNSGRVPLHHATNDYAARLLVECEFEKYMLDDHISNDVILSIDASITHQMLRAQDDNGLTPLQFIKNEIQLLQDISKRIFTEYPVYRSIFINPRRDAIRYLECWESPVTFHWKEGVKKTLSKFQAFLVSQILELLSRTAIEQVQFIILGYLTPKDLLNGWDLWVGRKIGIE